MSGEPNDPPPEGDSSSESSRIAPPHAETLLEESGDLQDSGDSTSESSRIAPPHAETLIEESGDSTSESSRIAPPHAETLMEESGDSTSESSRIASPDAKTVVTPGSSPLVEGGPKTHRPPDPGSADVHARTAAHATESDQGPVCPDEPLDEHIGGYRIERELARGGMGVVYLGVDPGLGRKVAIKALLAGEFASKLALERFQIEARSAARLRHPGIVGIHEVGVGAGGKHYLVMDFIEGGSLAEHLQKQRPEPREAATLAASLSQAVAYAHARGVIHRDLKPANVLIDPKGKPVVTDFGLAKEVERADGPTRSGQLVGTPAYMPPEQARGEPVDPRVDVYSLGAILYECLTGRPPFVAPSLPLLMSKLEGEDPTPIQKLVPGIPPDLETICLTCLEKEPEQRYSTAKSLAEDLERFLREEPIHARPATLTHRARKWFRRNRSLASAVGAVVFISAAIGVLGTAWFVDRLRDRSLEATRGQRAAESSARELAEKQLELEAQRDEAVRLRAEAILQRDEAETQRQAARKAEGEARKAEKDAVEHLKASGQALHLLTDVVSGDLAQIQDRRVREVRERLLVQLLGELERLDAHPDITLTSYGLRARTFLQQADMLVSKGRPDLALPVYAKAVAAARTKSDEKGLGAILQRSLVNQSIAYSMRGDVAAATSASREAVDLARAGLAKTPSSFQRSVLVAGLLRLSDQEADAGREPGARGYAEEAIREARLGQEPEDARTLSGALQALGRLERRGRNYDLARVHFQEAVDVERARLAKLPTPGPQDDGLSHMLRALAGEEARRGNKPAQLKLLEQALTFVRGRAKADEEDVDSLKELVRSLEALARAKLASGNIKDSTSHLVEALELSRAYYLRRPSYEGGDLVGDALSSLVKLEEARGNTGGARARAEENLVHWRGMAQRWRSVPVVHQGLLSALEIASRLRRAEGAPRGALPLAREAVDLQRKHLAKRENDILRSRNLAVVLERLGSAERDLGALDEAQKHYEESAAIRRRMLARAPKDRDAELDLAVILDRLGDLADTRRNHSVAHRSHEEAVGLMRKLALGPAGKAMRANLSVVLRKLGKHCAHDEELEEARELYLECKRIQEGLLAERPKDGAQALELAVTHDRLAALDQTEGSLGKAEKGFREALRIYVALARSNRRSLRLQRTVGAGYIRLALLLSERGQGKEALEAVRQNLGLVKHLVSKVPGHVELLREQAVAMFQNGELEAKHGELSRALTFYASAETAYEALLAKAKHYEKEGKQLAESIGAARQRIAWFQGQGTPTSATDWTGFGDFLRDRGEGDRALACYTKALAIEVDPLAGKKRRQAQLEAASLACEHMTPDPAARKAELDVAAEQLAAWAAALAAERASARAALGAAGEPEAKARGKRRTRGLERAYERARASSRLAPLHPHSVWPKVFPNTPR
jgi:serine/threonine protein kinase/tetratricopeptide (TPR) repeat protein